MEMRKDGKYLLPQPGHPVAIDFGQVVHALEIVEEALEAGEKVIIFTSLRGLYSTMKDALDAHVIRYMEVGNTPTAKRNALVRDFEASNATVLLSGTKRLNRGITAVGANHVVILNLEWSPEDTLQAEDRIHRPGQTRECHVHYLLGGGKTMDDQMYNLVWAKWKAQRAVQDREAQHMDVAEMLDEAAKANAELAVAKALSDGIWEEAEVRTVRKRKLRERPKRLRAVSSGGQMSMFTLNQDSTVKSTWEASVATAPVVVETKGGGSQMSMFEM